MIFKAVYWKSSRIQ